MKRVPAAWLRCLPGMLLLILLGVATDSGAQERRRVLLPAMSGKGASSAPAAAGTPELGQLAIQGGFTAGERVQQAISAYLDEQEAEQRKRLKERLEVIIADMARVLSLSDEARSRLDLAAAGAAERTLDAFRAQMENHVRNQTRAAGPGNIKEVLESAGAYPMNAVRVESEPMWTASVAKVLSPEQGESWRRAVSEREEYRRKAIVEMLLVGLDGVAALGTEQAEKLRPLAETAVKEYLPDLSRYYSDQRVDFRMVLLFVSGMPQAEVKGILSGEQYKKWEEATSEYSGWWDGIARNHEARLRAQQKKGGAQPGIGAGDDDGGNEEP